jgi:hypothetical protein
MATLRGPYRGVGGCQRRAACIGQCYACRGTEPTLTRPHTGSNALPLPKTFFRNALTGVPTLCDDAPMTNCRNCDDPIELDEFGDWIHTGGPEYPPYHTCDVPSLRRYRSSIAEPPRPGDR